MKRLSENIWLLILLSVAIAAVVSLIILHFWSQWSAAIIVVYGVGFFGGILFLPHKSNFGNAVYAGVLFGLLIPISIYMLRH